MEGSRVGFEVVVIGVVGSGDVAVVMVDSEVVVVVVEGCVVVVEEVVFGCGDDVGSRVVFVVVVGSGVVVVVVVGSGVEAGAVVGSWVAVVVVGHGSISSIYSRKFNIF